MKVAVLVSFIMLVLVFVVILVFSFLPTSQSQRSFPDDFMFGASTSSYQIEGGWDADGKTESIWDHLVHTNPSAIFDNTNGDIAADSYNNYRRDVEMMRELGLNVYRFSLSWPRILPKGFDYEINEAGVEFYNNYINEMLEYNIQPMITLYHWDMPKILSDLGGFMNPLFTNWFEDYARVAFTLFGDRVKLWITFNEPNAICNEGYETPVLPPMLNMTGFGGYYCSKTLVMAHAKAYHVYNNDFRAAQGGQVGITVYGSYFTPATDSEEDILAAELYRQMVWGIFSEPIFSEEGGFPKELLERVAQRSAEQGFPRSRLQDLTEEEKAFARGTADFVGLNHYTDSIISAGEFQDSFAVPSVVDDVRIESFTPAEWPVAESSWLALSPDGLYKILTYVAQKYNNPIIYITENGWSTTTGLVDDGRVLCFRTGLENILDALDEGVNVKGYVPWTLLDNFEWIYGYTVRFGIYEVDIDDPARTRTPRKSAFVYKEIVRSRVIDHEYDPDPETLIMTIDEGN